MMSAVADATQRCVMNAIPTPSGVNETVVPQAPTRAGWNWKWVGPAVLALGISLLAINSQSLWIDEADTAIIASQTTVSQWWQSLCSFYGGDTQMPGYMFYVWVWEKVFGHSEWWLRASNVPWLVLGFLAIPRRQVGYLVTLAASPFLWYYLGEARPYAMQIGATLVLIGSLWRWVEPPTESAARGGCEKFLAWSFCFGLVALSSSSLLGMVWAGAALGAALIVPGWQRSRSLLRGNLWLVVGAGIVLGALALFYLWSLKRGNRANLGHMGIANAVFILYEQLGFAGLGPGRIDLHANGLKAFWPFLVPLMCFAVVLGTALLGGCRVILREVPRRIWLGVTVAAAVATVFLLAVGACYDFSVLGRHCAPLMPCLLLPVAAGVKKNFTEGGGMRRILAIAFVGLCLVSGFSSRFCARHARDDYREAASIAIRANAEGARIWWCASYPGGAWYNIPLSQPGSPVAPPGQVWFINNPAALASLTNQAAPDVVFLSKPEIFDQHGMLVAFLEGNQYQLVQRFPAFTVWHKRGR